MEVVLDRRACSHFDDQAMAFVAAPGELDILVGASSQRIEPRGKVALR